MSSPDIFLRTFFDRCSFLIGKFNQGSVLNGEAGVWDRKECPYRGKMSGVDSYRLNVGPGRPGRVPEPSHS